MKELKKEEMKMISGGASTTLIVSAVIGLITLISGVLKGYSNPQKCNN